MKRKRIAAILTVLAVAVLCSGFSCSNYAKAGQLAKDFAATVLAAQQVEIQAHKAGYVDDTMHQAIQNELISVADAGVALDAAINKSHSASGALQQVTVIRQLLSDLLNNKIVGIKDQNTKLAIQAALLLCQTTIDNIAAFGGQ